jgi:protein-S-isoprenylcysteine O-methyltransferase Ste14
MFQAARENPLTLRKFAQRIRVPAGFLLAPLLLIAANPTPRSLMIGAAIAIAGLIIRAWASGYLKKNMELTISGPYARTRNPLYLGTFILGTGIAISSGALWFVALFMALYLLIYVPVMFAEAETLRKLFPGEYEQYSQQVPLFLPRLLPFRARADENHARGERRFALSQYIKHREYRAALGLLAVYALLTAKFLFIT